MKILALDSRVARRIVLMLAVFVAAPLVATSYLVAARVNTDLRAQTEQNLQKTAKAVGMEIFGQLQHVDELLRWYMAQLPSSIVMDTASMQESFSGLAEMNSVSGLWLINSDGDIEPVKGGAMPPEFDSRFYFAHINEATTQLTHVLAQGSGAMHTMLAVPFSHGDGERHWLLAQLSSDYLFGQYDADYPLSVCVFSKSSSANYCNRPVDPEWQRAVLQQSANRRKGSFTWAGGNQSETVTSYWSLFLKSRFEQGRWTIAIQSPPNSLLGGLANYQLYFPILAALVILSIFFTAMLIVRRSLSPLDKLTVATRTLATGRFETRVALDSNDEFEEMGDAFNEMAGHLGEQFAYQRELARLGGILTEAPTVQVVMKQITSALANMPEIQSAGGIVAKGFGTGDTSIYVHQAGGDKTEIDTWRGEETSLPDQFWSGSHEQMVASYPSLAELKLETESNATLAPVTLNGETKAVLVLTMTGGSICSETMTGFVLHVSDMLANTLRSLALRSELRFQADHDVLTGLANRKLLETRVQQAIKRCSQSGTACGLVIFDIDRFKLINDTKGHMAGDELLRQVANRLGIRANGFNLVSRLAGDEFVIFLDDLDLDSVATQVEKKMVVIQQTFNTPFTIGNWQVPVTCSVGAAVFPRDGAGFYELLQRADTAMYSAKNKGLGQAVFYTQVLEDRVNEQVALENDLRKGLDNNELRLHYQPVIDTKVGRVVGAEALIRWQHPERGLQSPFVFLGLAENMGLLPAIGDWVIKKAASDFSKWKKNGCDLSHIAVNLSGVEFENTHMVEDITDSVSQFGLEPSDIELEITETEIIKDLENSAQKITQLRRAGFKVALDDFGTGYASMEYLKQIPADKLKIERMFIKDLENSKLDQAIVKALTTLAYDLDMTVVAEGVETEQQLEILKSKGVKIIQGYLYSKPLPAIEFLDYVKMFNQPTALQTA
ncbi:MAG: EAL domain-containing protein [Porticoccaceae bacterium]|nr:EAL domain-containing protein [Porticoccaceae bacterium]